MKTKRIIPCLDVKDGKVVKGIRFREHRIMGDIEDLARRYQAEGADELVLYDISASPEGRTVDNNWVRRVADLISIPFCVAGGIRSVDDAQRVIDAGADKVSVNSPALARPALVDELCAALGPERVVVGIDSLRDDDGAWHVRQYTGDVKTTQALSIATLDWVQEVVARGAGEIVLNCMGQDGVRSGYDIEQLAAVREVCTASLVASGGAGTIAHFIQAFNEANVDAALSASAFHSGSIIISELKASLAQQGIAVNQTAQGD